MCFSSTASFGIGALLLAGGVAAVRQVKNRSQLPFASIPLIFSIQQFCEGFVWLSIDKDISEQQGTHFTMAFLAFAQILWPLWVPLSIALIEKGAMRRKLLQAVFFLGTLLSGYLLYCLLFYPVKTSVVAHHIRYDLGGPFHEAYVTGILYFIVTIVPPFTSSVRKMSMIGITSLLSFLLAFFFFSEAIISVWCFFAAAISVGVFVVLREESIKQLPNKIILRS